MIIVLDMYKVKYLLLLLLLMCGCMKSPNYKLDRVFEVDGRQGVCYENGY